MGPIICMHLRMKEQKPDPFGGFDMNPFISPETQHYKVLLGKISVQNSNIISMFNERVPTHLL